MVIGEIKIHQWFSTNKGLYFIFCIYNYFIHIHFSIIRDHIVYPEIRLNDNDRNFGESCRDVQSQKNSSFPPIAHDSQKQNSSVRQYF